MRRFSVFLMLIVAASMVYAQSEYISRVYDYCPAPGQFIGEHYPDIYEGDDHASVTARVDSLLVGATETSGALVSLGAWGGSVTFGFDHDIVNVAGAADLVVFGNAFLSGKPKDGYQKSSSEPGIIWVSADANGNGLPDDEWYQIAGSEYDSTTHQYEMTYYYDTADVRWTDNLGNEGWIKRNPFHQQPSYFPTWEGVETLTFRGSILPQNMHDFKGKGNFEAYAYAYGYADNQPNDSASAAIDLGWAVDADGRPANLSRIRFVRVQTGVQVDWGVSGEMSTEVCGAKDLHVFSSLHQVETAPAVKKVLIDGAIYIQVGLDVYDVVGKKRQ